MHIVIIAWLYVMLMFSVSYWPDVVGMTWRFLLFGALPVFIWLKIANFVRQPGPNHPARSGSPSDHSATGDDMNKNDHSR